ncbi:MAG TPA: tripartite tricarboxylate transporter substrate binding protein [Burkholderiales bacterium]|nr:tripartite tricarboxylate transporter substrate binding protein [Burkholderiales bacterium]
MIARRSITKYLYGLVVLVGFLPAGVQAQTGYPARTIRFIVPFTPGGSADIFARPIAQKMSESMGQQVVVENRPGSGGVLGSEAAAKAPPDGYTIMMGLTANVAVNPALYAKLPYDPLRDFAPVTLVASAPYALVVPTSLPARNAKELVALARAKPGELAYVSLGSGSMGHLSGELLASTAGVRLLHVPYKTLGQAIPDLMSGQVQLMFLGIASAQPHVRAGKLRAIAVSGARRSPALPQVPTVMESGIRGFEVTGWYGVFVPTGTPQEIIARLHREIVRALSLPDVRDRLSGEGAELVGNSPREFDGFVRSELAKWAKVVKLSGAKAE